MLGNSVLGYTKIIILLNVNYVMVVIVREYSATLRNKPIKIAFLVGLFFLFF
nr:MAG TPA: hypothetical protein [Caudoviricetes sp.]